MPTPAPTLLSNPHPGLLATPTARLPYQRDVLLRSFVLQRPQGTVVVYNSPGITEAATAIAALGPVHRVLINHAHESMYGQPPLSAPVSVGAADQAGIDRSLHVADVIEERQMIDDDLEAIPTPGHTAGTTSYLWDNGTDRFLFTGDFVWIEHGEWKAVVLDPRLRQDYLNSLALIRDLDFTVLVPWGATDDGPCLTPTTPQDRRTRIDAIIERVQAGGSR